jgi:hypothetical protein
MLDRRAYNAVQGQESAVAKRDRVPFMFDTCTKPTRNVDTLQPFTFLYFIQFSVRGSKLKQSVSISGMETTIISKSAPSGGVKSAVSTACEYPPLNSKPPNLPLYIPTV